MAESAVCRAWSADDCTGTEHCPPRCPQFVTRDGTAVLITPRNPDSCDFAGGLSQPRGQAGGPEAVFLAADVDGTTVGYARLRPAGDGDRHARLAVSSRFRDGGLRAELARQAAAHAAVIGAGRLLVEDPEPFAAAGFDLGTGERTALHLADPAVEAVMTPPRGRSRRDAGDPADRSRRDADESGKRARFPPGPFRTLFAPDRVAVVGATDRDGAIGRLLFENLSTYGGEVIPVTPRAERVFGREAPSSLSEAGDVDLAVIAVPPSAAIEALETAGNCGIGAAVVISAGFEEAGEREHAGRLRSVAAEHGVTLIGPNSMGVMSTASGLNASFSPRHPPRGSISLLSQSGSFVTAALSQAADRGLGFRTVVSLGNKAVVDEVDLLPVLDEDPGTDVVAAYLEAIDDGEAFLETARSMTTPVVVLKAGRTDAGASAAAAHSASLAGDDAAVDAALDRAGVLRANSAQQLFDYAAVLRGSVPDGDSVGIVTNAGGAGVLGTDAAAANGLDLASFEPKTRDRLASLLPDAASVANPTDVLGDADAERFATAIDTILGDPGVDVALTLTTPHPIIEYAEIIEAVGRRSRAHRTPVVACLMDGSVDAATRRALHQHGVAAYPDPSRAADAAAALCRYAASQNDSGSVSEGVEVDRERIGEIVDAARDGGRRQLGVESLSLLEACGIDVPPWEVAESPADAESAARRLGGPVVLKVASPDLAHKVDAGAVRLGVDPTEAEDAAAAMLADVREAAPDARIDGIVVQQQVDHDGGVETVLGASRSQFGPLLTFGLGGILVEHVEDVAFEVAPVDRERAHDLITSIDAASVLDGARGERPVDEEALVDAVVRLSALVTAAPEVAALDVNPLIAHPDGVTAVDLHVDLDDERRSTHPERANDIR